MSNHQTKGGIAELVGPLLKRLKLAKEQVPKNSEMEKYIDQIIPEVVKKKDILNSREIWDREQADYFGKIERQIDPWIDHKPREKASDLSQKATITEVGESSNTSYQKNKEVSKFEESSDCLFARASWQRRCLKSLLIFPENTKLKKRLVIYWWMAVCGHDAKALERVFFKLVDKKVLIPVDREHDKVMDHFTIGPIIHEWFMRNVCVSSEKREEGTWGLYRDNNYDYPNFEMLLNLDQRYLNSKDIMEISSRQDELRGIQLGSWHYIETEIQETGSEQTKSKDHIEVDQTDFLKKLGKNVRYLSLRGISGITELPESIGRLKFLEILDLRACYNLEKLPQKPRSTLKPKLIRWALPQERWFNWLTVLDISECYLLDHMPKWICELSYLEVLKGFVIGNLGNENQSCQLVDLSKLNKLWKLSIRIAIDVLGPQVFRGFNSLDSLLVLTITWGENKYKEIPTYSLPRNLEKLDIRCYPEAEASKLQNPEELKNLKRLYIRGGNLTKIPCHDNWKVEILRLRFLKKLVPTDWNEVRNLFKNLRYAEYVGCPRPENFPTNNGNSWRNEEQVRRLMINFNGINL